MVLYTLCEAVGCDATSTFTFQFRINSPTKLRFTSDLCVTSTLQNVRCLQESDSVYPTLQARYLHRPILSSAIVHSHFGTMATSSNSTPTPPDAPVEEDDNAADMPLTMAASVVLDQLPRDAHKALETAGELEQEKGMQSSACRETCYCSIIAST